MNQGVIVGECKTVGSPGDTAVAFMGEEVLMALEVEQLSPLARSFSKLGTRGLCASQRWTKCKQKNHEEN